MPVATHPLEAAYIGLAGKNIQFWCPIEDLRHPNGWSFSTLGGNPFVAAINNESAQGLSLLRKYFAKWQPCSAAEAIISTQFNGSSILHKAPSHALYLTPWSAKTLNQIVKVVERWTVSDRREHGLKISSFTNSLFPLHGPVREDVIKSECNRLDKVYNSIKKNGYQLSNGPILVTIIRHEEKLRFVIVSGFHRAAVCMAAGYSHIPASFHPKEPIIVDSNDIQWWPAVCNGYWTVSEAISYTEQLFSFDDSNWLINLLKP